MHSLGLSLLKGKTQCSVAMSYSVHAMGKGAKLWFHRYTKYFLCKYVFVLFLIRQETVTRRV